MSNHHHTGIYDPAGNYPAFLEHFHKLFAKCQNSLRGRWENFWSSEQTSVVRLVDPHDAIEKMVYALTNPVKDGLVERAHHWPGVSSLAAILHGKSFTGSRPKHFFRDEGVMPDTVVLTFARPRGFEQHDRGRFRDVCHRPRPPVRRAHHGPAAYERAPSSLGRQSVLRQAWRGRPRDREPRRGSQSSSGGPQQVEPHRSPACEIAPSATPISLHAFYLSTACATRFSPQARTGSGASRAPRAPPSRHHPERIDTDRASIHAQGRDPPSRLNGSC